MTSTAMSRRAAGRRRNHLPTLLMLPAITVLVVVLLYPMLVALYSSLFDLKILNVRRGGTFVGLGNYTQILASGAFWKSFAVTVAYTVAAVAGTYLVGLGTAMLLNRPLRGRTIFRTLLILPWAVPQVVAVLVWTWMLDPDFGVINYAFEWLGLLERGVNWRTDSTLALPAVLFVTIWALYPIATVMILAGLNGISDELYEAASTDGAGAWRKFVHVTWPGLSAVNTVLFLLLTLMTFTRVVTIIYLMTGGGPDGRTETLPVSTYLQAFKFFDLGYASALGTIVLVVAAVFSGAYLFVTRRRQGS